MFFMSVFAIRKHSITDVIPGKLINLVVFWYLEDLITSAKEGMFLVWCVCLSVCQQDYTKNDLDDFPDIWWRGEARAKEEDMPVWSESAPRDPGLGEIGHIRPF